MTTIRELDIKVDVTGNADKRLKAFGLTVSDIKAGVDLMIGAVRFAGEAVRSLTTDLANQGDQIAKNAKNLGIGVQALQELDFAAKLSGQSAKEVQTAIQRMAKGLNDARVKGAGPFADAMTQAGLSISEFDALSPDEAFERLADAIAGVEDPLERAALAQDFFGRGGKTLLPLLNEGSKGIRGMREEFQALGGGFTDDGAASAEEFNDALLRMNTVIDSVKIAIGEELFPVVTEIVDEIRVWANENREAIREELVTFVKDLVKVFKDLAPALKELIPLVRDIILFFADAVVETKNLFNEIKQLDERLESDSPKAWKVFKTAAMAALDPLGSLFRLFQSIIKEIDKFITRLETGGGKLGTFARGAREALEFVGILDEQRAGRGAPGAPSKPPVEARTPLTSATADQLRSIANDPNSSPGRRKRAKSLIPSAEEFDRSAARQATFANAQANAAASNARFFREEQIAKRRGGAASRRRRQSRAVDASRRTGGAGGKKDGPLSDAELLKIISQAGASGQSLDSLVGGRSLEGTAPPIIAVTVTNIDVDQAVNAPVTVNGVPGQSSEEIAEMVDRRQRAALQSELRGAMEMLDPLVSR